MTHDEILAEILKELAEQRAEVQTLRAEVRRLQVAQAPASASADEATSQPRGADHDATPRQPSKTRRGTSRRALLRATYEKQRQA